MEMPDAVKWLLPIVVGESWPEGDETKLRALRDAWHTASSAIGPASEAGNQAASGIRDNWTGEGFSLAPTAPNEAMDVFRHPFAYRASRGAASTFASDGD